MIYSIDDVLMYDFLSLIMFSAINLINNHTCELCCFVTSCFSKLGDVSCLFSLVFLPLDGRCFFACSCVFMYFQCQHKNNHIAGSKRWGVKNILQNQYESIFSLHINVLFFELPDFVHILLFDVLFCLGHPVASEAFKTRGPGIIHAEFSADGPWTSLFQAFDGQKKVGPMPFSYQTRW